MDRQHTINFGLEIKYKFIILHIKLLARLREDSNYQNLKMDITTDLREMKRIVNVYYKHLTQKNGKFPEKTSTMKLAQEET